MRGRRQRGLVEDALARSRACARGSSRRRRRSPRRNSARAARAARSPPRASLSISSVFGGKNSNETRMRLRRPCTNRLARRVHHATSRSAHPRAHARIAREPERHRDLAVGARLRRERLCAASTSRPAAASHCVTVSAAKPSRRCACSSRRNSRSCGAKSTTSSRPAGAQHARRLARSRARRRRGSAAPDG